MAFGMGTRSLLAQRSLSAGLVFPRIPSPTRLNPSQVPCFPTPVEELGRVVGWFPLEVCHSFDWLDKPKSLHLIRNHFQMARLVSAGLARSNPRGFSIRICLRQQTSHRQSMTRLILLCNLQTLVRLCSPLAVTPANSEY